MAQLCKIHTGLYALLLLLFFSCEQQGPHEKKNLVVAEFGNKVLLKSQLAKVIPDNLSGDKDSIQFANEYIKKWINQQLLFAEAEKKLSTEELNIEDELNEYKQELVIHKFKNKKFEEIIGSTVPDSEIKKYYQNNLRLFTLEKPIVQVIYVVFPIETALTLNFRDQLKSTRENEVIEREEFIFKYAKKYDDFNLNWIYLEYFNEIAGVDITVDQNFLKRNNLIEFSKNSEIHLIYVSAYMLAGEQAPFEFVKPRINSLILNQRKLDFLRQFKDSLYNDALKYNKFRVFNQ